MIALLFALLFCFELQSFQEICCQAKEIQYSYKNVSNDNDGYARNLATAPGKLAVLALRAGEAGMDRGRIYVAGGRKLTPPFQTAFWAHFIEMNKNFIVLGSWQPAILIYQASSPFQLIYTIPIRYYGLKNLKMTKKNTIVAVVSYDDEDSQEHHCDVLVYNYDGVDSWHLSQTLATQDYPQLSLGLAVSESHLVVQSYYNRPPFKVLWVFKKIKGLWVRREEILDTSGMPFCFGDSMVVDGDKLAVTSFAGDSPPNGTTIVYTYHYQHASGKWTLDSKLDIPGEYNFVAAAVPAMKNDILAMTVNDKRQPEVCSVVYKLSKPALKSEGRQTWQQVATLKTNGDPAKIGDHYNNAVRIEGDKVYTGRWVSEESSTDVGKVFIHDISEFTEN